jgi:hypothetical protein
MKSFHNERPDLVSREKLDALRKWFDAWDEGHPQ